MKLLKNITVLLLIISTLFSVFGCNKNKKKNEEENIEENAPIDSCTVTVKTPLGHPISGVTVFLHLDEGRDYNVCTDPAITDANGQVTFTLDPDKSYSIGVMGYPEVFTARAGNTRGERYLIEAKQLDVVLETNFEAEIPDRYRVGDYIIDIPIVDIDGNSHNIYSILKEKRAVILNFWFAGCGPCASEFPALNSAYNSNKDKIEVLAIDDCDPISAVLSYEASKGFSLDFPLCSVSYGSAISNERFGASGWPTTVVIDRYGKVSFVHTGAVTSVNAWNELFDYYTSDSYNGMPFSE